MDRMMIPVLCNRCGQVYDLCGGEVVQRYADCTVYLTPCCRQQVDDREWVSLPAFRRLKPGELDEDGKLRRQFYPNGEWR